MVDANSDGFCDEWVDLTVTDVDGNSYETVQIGGQLWMAENLKVTHYSDGQPIATGYNNGDWSILEEGAYAVYDNDPANAAIYGNLYNWYAVDDDRGLCMDGWHIPSDEEFMVLEMELGMSEEEANASSWRGTDEGSKLAGNSDLWNGGYLVNNSDFGTSGFTGLPAGHRLLTGNYTNMGSYGYFWSSTEYSNTNAWGRWLRYSYSIVYRYNYYKQSGFSIRCLGD
jgi:uncharacterized protein (TIGR02145 family)